MMFCEYDAIMQFYGIFDDKETLVAFKFTFPVTFLNEFQCKQ